MPKLLDNKQRVTELERFRGADGNVWAMVRDQWGGEFGVLASRLFPIV
jgi:hypothetical protein